MSETSNIGVTLNLIISIGTFLIVLGGAIVSLFLRFRKKLKFVDYHLSVDRGIITTIKFTIYNKTSKPIEVQQIGCMFKKRSKKESLIDIRGKSVLPKQNEDYSHGSIPLTDVRAKRQTDILKKDINRLFISHNVGIDIFRRIKDFKKKIRESEILGEH